MKRAYKEGLYNQTEQEIEGDLCSALARLETYRKACASSVSWDDHAIRASISSEIRLLFDLFSAIAKIPTRDMASLHSKLTCSIAILECGVQIDGRGADVNWGEMIVECLSSARSLAIDSASTHDKK